jgi:glycosyltransferase involved in cell wall biosynthesis
MPEEKQAKGLPIVFDLTEVLLASTGKLRYYGIARVAAETGAELRKLDASVQFAVFSQSHGGLLEVFPSLREDGGVDLNVPTGIRQLRVRSHHYTKSTARDLILAALRPLLNHKNRKNWNDIAPGMKLIDMTGKTLVSCSRPKIIVEILCAHDQKGMPCDVIPMLHDMIPLHDFKHQRASFPRNFLGDNQFVIARAKAVLTVSEFTRQEIIDFSAKGTLPPVPEISAVQLVHECASGVELSEQTPPSQPYILTVGSMLGRKNLDRVFEAMQLLKRDGKETPLLVLAGALRGKTKAYLQSDDCAAIRDYVVFYQNPNQTDLVLLYEQAMAVIMPSRMEGWGLPAGEALWCGTPVICSTAPVLKEVCGDLGIYFDPDSAEELANSINRILTDQEFANNLRNRIYESKQELRTWGHVAADLKAVLNRYSNYV